jgi:hypothetical protein
VVFECAWVEKASTLAPTDALIIKLCARPDLTRGDEEAEQKDAPLPVNQTCDPSFIVHHNMPSVRVLVYNKHVLALVLILWIGRQNLPQPLVHKERPFSIVHVDLAVLDRIEDMVESVRILLRGRCPWSGMSGRVLTVGVEAYLRPDGECIGRDIMVERADEAEGMQRATDIDLGVVPDGSSDSNELVLACGQPVGKG